METGIGKAPDIWETSEMQEAPELRETSEIREMREIQEASACGNQPDMQGDGFLERINEAFDCGERDIRTYSPLTLAYIGDAVYDLIIRSVVVERGNRAVNLLHRSAVKYVNAGAQARMIEALQESLTQEEEDIYRRGRNTKSHTAAKNAAIEDYRKATGMEALVGYLYLTGRTARILELVKLGLEKAGLEI